MEMVWNNCEWHLYISMNYGLHTFKVPTATAMPCIGLLQIDPILTCTHTEPFRLTLYCCTPAVILWSQVVEQATNSLNTCLVLNVGWPSIHLVQLHIHAYFSHNIKLIFTLTGSRNNFGSHYQVRMSDMYWKCVDVWIKYMYLEKL